MSGESKLIGPWEKVLKDMDKVGKTVLEAAQLANLQNAHVLERTIVKHIENQDLGWKKLDPAYKKYKERKRLSNQILIATSTLMNSITVQITKDKLGAFVGVLRLSKRKDGKPPVLIAAVHEFGSPARGIPKRPYLRPSFKEKEAEMRERYKKLISKALEEVGR